MLTVNSCWLRNLVSATDTWFWCS